MRDFRVWAPRAERVSLAVEQRQTAMESDENGWWHVSVDAAPGARYAFHLDDGPQRPDPRSPFQPDGVHARSCVIDPCSFRWRTQSFQPPPLSSAVIYELHVGTFTPAGTFEAAIEKLDHLAAVGVTHVELMPVAAFDGDRGWGYDGVALFAPHAAYGGPEGLVRLVDACHARGLAVLLDVVYNHLGPVGNYLRDFGPYFSSRHATPWGEAINFDGPGSDEVRRFFIDNALMWLRDYRFDGLRLDAVHAIVDTSALPFLEQLAIEVEQLQAHLGRRLSLIAESDLNDPRLIRSREAHGFGMDAQWSDDFHHALHTVISGERGGYYADFGSLDMLARCYESPFLYAGDRSPFRQRVHGRSPSGLPSHRFVTYLHNHDQIGNRAAGDRIGQQVGTELYKVGLALVLLSPYVPMLFQGEEWGSNTPFPFFVGFTDQELLEAVRKGRLREFVEHGWRAEQIPDPASPATFQRAKLDWNELSADEHTRFLEWTRQLIALRRAIPDLTDGRLERVHTACDQSQRWLRIERGAATVVANLAVERQVVPLCQERPRRLLLASNADAGLTAAGLDLPARSVAVLGE